MCLCAHVGGGEACAQSTTLAIIPKASFFFLFETGYFIFIGLELSV